MHLFISQIVIEIYYYLPGTVLGSLFMEWTESDFLLKGLIFLDEGDKRDR